MKPATFRVKPATSLTPNPMQWNQLYRDARRSAQQRGIPFRLAMDEFNAMKFAALGRCQVTGIPFRMDRDATGRKPFAPSLDRIDSTKDYSVKNVRLVCLIVNLAMNTWGDEPFWQMVRSASLLIEEQTA